MEDNGKTIRFRNGGKKYIAEFLGDNFVSQKLQGTFVKPMAMFRIWDEHQKDVIGCITFTEHLLIDSVWAQPHAKHFPSNYRVDALVNLLHYLPFDPTGLKEIYNDCFEYRFDREFIDNQTDNRLCRIKASDSFEATFQRQMFGDATSNLKIQDAALEIMFNHWEDHPSTNILVDVLTSILPVAEIYVLKNLILLRDEGKIHASADPSNPQTLISVGLEPQTIRELDDGFKQEVKYPSVIKHIYGPNIENTTSGANSPIVINRIETIFGEIQKEIEARSDMENKEEVSQAVEALEAEITDGKDPKKVAGLITKITGSANWVYQKILTDPYVSGIILELLSKAVLG